MAKVSTGYDANGKFVYGAEADAANAAAAAKAVADAAKLAAVPLVSNDFDNGKFVYGAEADAVKAAREAATTPVTFSNSAEDMAKPLPIVSTSNVNGKFEYTVKPAVVLNEAPLVGDNQSGGKGGDAAAGTSSTGSGADSGAGASSTSTSSGSTGSVNNLKQLDHHATNAAKKIVGGTPQLADETGYLPVTTVSPTNNGQDLKHQRSDYLTANNLRVGVDGHFTQGTLDWVASPRQNPGGAPATGGGHGAGSGSTSGPSVGIPESRDLLKGTDKPAIDKKSGDKVYAGGNPNFDESTGQFKNGFVPSTKPGSTSPKPHYTMPPTAGGKEVDDPIATIMPVTNTPKSNKPTIGTKPGQAYAGGSQNFDESTGQYKTGFVSTTKPSTSPKPHYTMPPVKDASTVDLASQVNNALTTPIASTNAPSAPRQGMAGGSYTTGTELISGGTFSTPTKDSGATASPPVKDHTISPKQNGLLGQS